MKSSATTEQIKAFWTGYRAGVSAYAWRKNGDEYVGYGNSTLEEAIAQTRKLEKERLLRVENCDE